MALYIRIKRGSELIEEIELYGRPEDFITVDDICNLVREQGYMCNKEDVLFFPEEKRAMARAVIILQD